MVVHHKSKHGGVVVWFIFFKLETIMLLKLDWKSGKVPGAKM